MTRKQDPVSLDSLGLTTLPPRNTVTEGRWRHEVTTFSLWYWVTKTCVSRSPRLTGRQMLAAFYCLYKRCFKQAEGRRTKIKLSIWERAGWASWSKLLFGCWHTVAHFHCPAWPWLRLIYTHKWGRHRGRRCPDGKIAKICIWQDKHCVGCPVFFFKKVCSPTF